MAPQHPFIYTTKKEKTRIKCGPLLNKYHLLQQHQSCQKFDVPTEAPQIDP